MAKGNKRAKLADELATARRHVTELKAQLAITTGIAFDNLPKAAELHGSGVILTLTALGGQELVGPVCIRDGLSLASVSAIQKDLCRSFELTTLVNPAMARARNESQKGTEHAYR